MSKKILLFSVLLLMTPALALASSARLEGLGVLPDFIEDYANIFNYPVSICRYPAVVIGELGYVEGWGKGFGATMGLGQDNAYGVFGIELRENSSFAPVPGTAGSPGSQLDVLWGMNFGKASLGLRFDRSSSELEVTTDGVGAKFSPLYIFFTGLGLGTFDMASWNTTGFGVSGGMEVREADKVEATFEYRALNFEVAQLGGAGMSIEDKDNPSWGVWGRGFFAMGENLTVIPMAGYNKYDFSWEFKDPTTPGEDDNADQTLSNVRGALAMRVDVGSFFLVGIGLSQWKMEIENSLVTPLGTDARTLKFTSTSLPFFFGCFEADLRDWLTIRFGAKKHLLEEKVTVEQYDGTKNEIKTANGSLPDVARESVADDYGIVLPVMDEPFLFSMGVGFKWNDIEIDATLNEDYPFTGMYWLSGDSVTPFGKISVTYYY